MSGRPIPEYPNPVLAVQVPGQTRLLETCMLWLRFFVVSPSLLILIILIYPSTAYLSPFCLDLEDIAELLLQKSSLTLTTLELIPETLDVHVPLPCQAQCKSEEHRDSQLVQFTFEPYSIHEERPKHAPGVSLSNQDPTTGRYTGVYQIVLVILSLCSIMQL